MSCVACGEELVGVRHVCKQCVGVHLCHACDVAKVPVKQHSSAHSMSCVVVLSEMAELPPDDERIKFVTHLQQGEDESKSAVVLEVFDTRQDIPPNLAPPSLGQAEGDQEDSDDDLSMQSGEEGVGRKGGVPRPPHPHTTDQSAFVQDWLLGAMFPQ